MPEVVLQLCWPDGEASSFYSPSTVIYDFFKPGDTLSIAELEQKGLAALEEASERVRARYGFACSRTDEEALKLKLKIAKYGAGEQVHVSAPNN
ncbi:MAG: MSMEG_0570 family nitrogen starvation response protein [Prochlorococcaceae cyanobacterium]